MGFYLFIGKFVHAYSVSWSSSLASTTFCPAIPFSLDCFLFLISSSLTTMSFSHACTYLLVGNTSTTGQLKRWEDIWWQSVLSLHHDVLEIKLRLLGLVAVLLPIETSCPPKGCICSFPGFYLIGLSWFLFSPSVGDWTQGLALVSQALYHWAKSSPPMSFFLYFNDPSLISCLYDCGWGLITKM